MQHYFSVITTSILFLILSSCSSATSDSSRITSSSNTFSTLNGSSDSGSSGSGSNGGAGASGAHGVGPTITQFTKVTGPIRVISGQVLTGVHVTNPNGPCIVADRVSDVVIHNNKIGPCASTVEGIGISASNVVNIKVTNNYFDDVSTGLYVALSNKGNILFEKNYATKVRGPMPRGQMVQLNEISGPNLKVRCNVSDQKLGGYGTGPEDHVSLFKSSGTAASPILVEFNKIRGGGSGSGGGLLTGDYGGSYQIIRNNILVNPGQYGISIAGGDNHKLLNNKVFIERNSWTNIGMHIWAQDPSPCHSNEISGNRVIATHRDGYINSWWNGNNCGSVKFENNVINDSSLSADIWNEEFAECK